ncbi:PGN_0703 family putative restriction endonuclease [Nocardioides aurantiacus]|uniref:PD-(D/E)XK nuclease-like domain-containing protein n=1 Tax=Nocardioides aurantiacus TaxID=86796 RepID=A0A3N2CZX1_9ACTN|nr:hypothetical protein [Nocardioides aurantiacus]ROR93059.1 hypothetical protein EDD33_3964 [Nocardioides aurantiacus]
MIMEPTPTQAELETAHCWFDSDKAGGAEMTEFKRLARYRQHRWATEVKGVRAFGTHSRTRGGGVTEVENGTKLLNEDADRGLNFLTRGAHAAAMDRVAQKQPHETLDERRLRRDLLSSMPMAFNLFGDAARADNNASRAALARVFGVADAPVSDLVFEWSPERRSDAYTRDRTAFDVALRLGDESAPRTVVGIETKYHEHCARETRPSPAKAEARQRHDQQTAFLVEIAERSGVFASGWQDAVLDTDLRQLWRDHLLALSMRNRTDLWTTETRYVLLFPRRNVSFAAAAERYNAVLAEPGGSFAALAIEDVVDSAFLDTPDAAQLFRQRYLW